MNIIDYRLGKSCMGCSGCYSICPTNALEMIQDPEGFYYPVINEKLCIDCEKCIRTCPVINIPTSKEVLESYILRCRDQKQYLNSSSGGIANLISLKILDKGGVVFGVAFNEQYTASHIEIKNKEQLHLINGSKYMQSYIGETFKRCRSLLKEGKSVAFFGTPCQIAGLKRFLSIKYENLLLVDLACHSVPSPLVWRCYLYSLIKNDNNGNFNINFRKKVKRKLYGNTSAIFSISIMNSDKSYYEKSLYETHFGRGFSKGLFSRKSCYNCFFKDDNSGSDLTIGDYWCAEERFPSLPKDFVYSFIIARTDSGKKFCRDIKVDCSVFKEADYFHIKRNNSGLKLKSIKNDNRDRFFSEFCDSDDREKVAIIKKYTKKSTMSTIRSSISFIIRLFLFPFNIKLESIRIHKKYIMEKNRKYNAD